MIVKAIYPSPIGPLTLAAEGDALMGLWLEGQRHFAPGVPPDAPEQPDHPALRRAAEWLDRYFAGEAPEIGGMQLNPRGTAFQQRVWAALCGIPYGETVTYGDLARRLGCPKAFQAVGGAVGRNPISIIIPCHRVVGAKGALTGYAGGIDRKKYLLDLERG